TPPPVTRFELLAALESAVREVLSTRWAPLYVQPGIGGREFFFSHSRETFEALCRARPHLSEALRAQVDQFLAKEWIAYPPYAATGQYPLKDGKRREYFAVPPEYVTSSEKQPHAFAGVYATTVYLGSGGQEPVAEAWPKIRSTFADFAASEWSLDPVKGDLEANRYDISLHSIA